MLHKNITGADAVHPNAYVQNADPGAVGANKEWLDTTGGVGAYVRKIRNAGNTAWDIETVGSGAHAASHLAAGADALVGLSPSQVAGTAVVTADSRLSDARTPTAHAHPASDITSGLLANARIATGVPDTTKFLRDDQVWAAVVASDATKLPLAGGTMTGTITSTLGTLTTADKPFLSGTATWNDAAVVFKGIFLNITRTAAATASKLIDLQLGGVSKFSVDGDGQTARSVYDIYAGHFIASAQGFCDSLTAASFFLSTNLMWFGSNGAIVWNTSNPYVGTDDTGLKRKSAGVVEVNNATAGTYAAIIAKEFRSAAPTSANGQYLSALSLTELTTIAAAPFTDTAIQMPANSVIEGITVRVITDIPTATTFAAGDSGNATRFLSGISTAATTTDAGAGIIAPYKNAAALSIRITPNLTPGAATGQVRITVHFKTVTSPIS